MVKRVAVIPVAILLASFVFTIAMPVGKAQTSSMKVYVDPSKVANVSLAPNTTFNISVKVDNIPADPGVAGIQFQLSWNSSVLNGVSMTDVIFHETIPPDQISNLWQLKNKVAADSASYAYTYQSTSDAISGGYAPINGSYTVAIITLKVVGTGECPIHFGTTIFGDPNGLPLTIELDDGFFNNLAPPSLPKTALLYVDPATVANSSLVPNNNFTVNVNVVNASGLAGLEFKLGFNASVLHANSVASGSSIPGSATPITQIDNTAAFVRFNVSLSTPLSGNGTLAVIQFQVQADKARNSTLHLYNVTLVDSTGQALPSNTVDGSFTNALTIMGDLNGDGVVDIKDAILAAKAYGSSPGDPNWNPVADLDGNGTVNIIDLILLCMNFGRTA
ncbi:MAG: cohesin domain-containing protein [Candidatus Bathyarchaeia archaeon]|jgi:hypothetical protein